MEDQYDNNTNKGKLFGGTTRNNIFKTPDDYFEKLSVNIADRIHVGEPRASQKLVTLKRLAITACVSVVIVSGLFYMNSMRDQKATLSVWSYDDLVGSGIQIDEVMILEAYEKESANNILKNNGTETQHLKDYLIENNTDISLIINEL